MPVQALVLMLRMNLWHSCEASDASLDASMAAARLSTVLTPQPSTASCALVTACAVRQNLLSA